MHDELTCPHCRQRFSPIPPPLRTACEGVDPETGERAAEVTSGGVDSRLPAEDRPVGEIMVVDGQRRQGRRRTWRGRLLRTALAASCLAAAGVVLGGVLGWRPGLWWPWAFRSGMGQVEVVALVPPPPAGPPNAAPPEAPAGLRPKASSVLASLHRAVVQIESDRPGADGSLGAGFVIDAEGLVATSYHVVSAATRARVRFHGGAVYDVAGYAAVDPALDLAILQLSETPGPFQPIRLQLDEELTQLTPVIAVGHPHGVEFSTFDGTVSQVLQTSQLPARSQEFLGKWMRGQIDHRWIQHTARTAEGYSGGPLLNEAGEAVGVNIWMDRQTGTGYALHAEHLQQLRERLLPQVAPLETYAREDARAAALVERLSESYLNQLVEDAEAMKWAPAGLPDYRKLQELAWAVTLASQPQTLRGGEQRGGLAEEKLAGLVQATDRLVKRLGQLRWNAVGQVVLVNELAAEVLDRPGAGVFFFGTVERVVSGEDGTRAALIQLAGMERSLFLPLDGQLLDPVPGSNYLVLGVNFEGRVMRYGENPLRPVVAPVILSRTLLPLDK
jgi:S1-C subfamily serine protease